MRKLLALTGIGLLAAGLVLALPGPLSAKPKPKAPAADEQADPVWPPPPDDPRIKWVRFVRDEYDVGHKKKSPLLEALAGKAQNVMRLVRPMSAVADASGNLFVLDFHLGLVKFDFENRQVINLSQKGGYQPRNPVGITMDSGFLYSSDSRGNSVTVMDFAGRVLRQITDPKQVNWPVGLAVDEGANLLFVANGKSHSISVFDRLSGKVVRSFGKRGKEPGQMNHPSFITLLPDSRLAVVDSLNFRVQIFSYSGKFMKEFGKLGNHPGELFRPKGIAADSDGNIYVVDGEFSNIQVFDQEGRLLGIIGGPGQGKGQFKLPVGISCRNDRIVVCDQLNGRIQVLQYIPKQNQGGVIGESELRPTASQTAFQSFDLTFEGGLA